MKVADYKLTILGGDFRLLLFVSVFKWTFFLVSARPKIRGGRINTIYIGLHKLLVSYTVT